MTRTLPQAEWPRLVGTELETVWPHLDPSRATVIVVERAGQILACWAKLTVTHLEGLWIAPAHRKGTVGGRLLAAMRAAVQADGSPTVMTSALSPDIEALITHYGGQPLPGAHFVMRMD